MKSALILTLASAVLSANAAENFGSIRFHSSVPEEQVAAMKADISYLYTNPVLNVDEEFIALTELKSGSGPDMHNWVVNRVRHIVGELFVFDVNFRARDGYLFPQTAMPELPGMGNESIHSLVVDAAPVSTLEESEVKTIMTNLGGALYLTGKSGFDINDVKTPMLLGLLLDGIEVYATSPRVGILQVGEGLFDKTFSLNPDLTAPANSINRLATLFHEARHSDGNSKSTSFPHALCPNYHTYGGHYACETSSNGPYSVGALSTRALLINCQTCSMEEKTALAVSTLDSFSRILNGPNHAYRLYEYKKVEKIYLELLSNNSTLLETATPEEKPAIEQEIAAIKSALAEMKQDMDALEMVLDVVTLPMDATPEGYFMPVSLEASARSMLSSKPAP